jgi:hypothetical protein
MSGKQITWLVAGTAIIGICAQTVAVLTLSCWLPCHTAVLIAMTVLSTLAALVTVLPVRIEKTVAPVVAFATWGSHRSFVRAIVSPGAATGLVMHSCLLVVAAYSLSSLGRGAGLLSGLSGLAALTVFHYTVAAYERLKKHSRASSSTRRRLDANIAR